MMNRAMILCIGLAGMATWAQPANESLNLDSYTDSEFLQMQLQAAQGDTGGEVAT